MKEQIESKKEIKSDIRAILILILIVLVFLALILAQFLPSYREISFDSKLWIEDGNEGGYPEKRDYMLNDLLKNYPLKGKTYHEIEAMLGRNEMDNLQLDYNVVTDFRWDIDPRYTKYLVIYFDKDSIATGYKVQEWDADKN